MGRTPILLLSILLAAGCVPHPLVKAVESNDLDQVRSLIESGTDVNQRGGFFTSHFDEMVGMTALHYAARHGYMRIARYLIEKGADVNASRPGRTPLHEAARGGHADMVRLLVEHGADVKTRVGDSGVLYLAMANGDLETVRALLNAGADVDCRNWSKWTCLHRAAYYGHADVARLLLERGADASRINRKGFTARDIALQHGYHDVAALIDDREEERKLEKEVAIRLKKEQLVRRMESKLRDRMPSPSAGMGEPLAPAFKSGPRPHDFAVVVGIEKYSDLPDARFAERDAAAVTRYMEALGVPRRNIIHLAGAKAGRAGLVKYLNSWLPKNVKPDSRVYFYFSGHGAPDVKTGKAYLVPWDGDPRFLEDTAYPVDRLYARLSDLPAKDVVVALDACFSGAGGRSVLAEGARPLVTKVASPKTLKKKITLLTAASGNEITSTLKERGHGMFTYFLLKGLDGAAEDDSGRVTARSLYRYLKPKVQDEARRQNREQTPTLQTKTDLVLRDGR